MHAGQSVTGSKPAQIPRVWLLLLPPPARASGRSSGSASPGMCTTCSGNDALHCLFRRSPGRCPGRAAGGCGSRTRRGRRGAGPPAAPPCSTSCTRRTRGGSSSCPPGQPRSRCRACSRRARAYSGSGFGQRMGTANLLTCAVRCGWVAASAIAPELLTSGGVTCNFQPLGAADMWGVIFHPPGQRC